LGFLGKNLVQWQNRSCERAYRRNVYAIEGKPVFVMPNGEIRTERPSLARSSGLWQ